MMEGEGFDYRCGMCFVIGILAGIFVGIGITMLVMRVI